jgi:protein-S-isoprenylcysteine O-methyltransferase Ste14
MYLGITLMLLGIALLFGSVSAFLPAAAFPILMDRRFVRVEEAMLAARVRRWL